MKSRVYFVACALYWGILFWWRLVVAHAVQGAGGAKTNKFISSVAFFRLPRTVLSQRRYLETREEQGQRSRAYESHQSEDAGSAVPPSCDYSPSFVQNSVDVENDVSCFPHDVNIGSLTPEIEVLVVPTVKDCYRRCRSHERCSHFTYNLESKKCYLKEGAPEFYTRIDDVTGPRSCDTSCYVGCLTYNTNPIATLDGRKYAPALCQTACRTRSDCRAFVYDKETCKLFGKGFSAYRAVSGGDTLAGPKDLCENKNDLRLPELIDGHRLGSCMKMDNIASKSPEIPGTTREAPTLAACQQRCQSHSTCQHFTYNLVTKFCFMKANKQPHYDYGPTGDITGDKNCVPS